MSAVQVARFLPRGPNLNRPLIIARDPTRLISARASILVLRRGTFATSSRRDSKKPSQNTDSEIPKFNFKNLGASPPVRRVLIASIFALGIIECAAWLKFLPKITGGHRQEPSS